MDDKKAKNEGNESDENEVPTRPGTTDQSEEGNEQKENGQSDDVTVDQNDRDVQFPSQPDEPAVVQETQQTHEEQQRENDPSLNEQRSTFRLRDNRKETDTTNVEQTDSSTEIYRFLKTYGKNADSQSNGNLLRAEAFIYMTIPPDGGYAWVILVLAFISQLIVDGILFSVGGLLPSIAKDLSLSESETALIVSMQIGPIASAFVNKYGFRPVAVTGGLFASTAYMLASFSDGLVALILTFSIMAGISLGLVLVCSQLIISYYFERLRPLAAGVSSSGSGAGVFVFSFVNGNLVKQISWRNIVRMDVGFFLLVTILTCAYLKVQPTKIGRIVEYLSESDSESYDSDEFQTSRYENYLTSLTDLLRTSTINDTDNFASPEDITRRLVHLRDRRDSHVEIENVIRNSNAHRTLRERFCPCYLAKGRRSTTIATASQSKHYLIQHDPLERGDIFHTGAADYTQSLPITSELLDRKDIEVIPGKENKAQTISYTLSVMHAGRPTTKRKSVTKWNIKNILHPKVVQTFQLLFDIKLLYMTEFQMLITAAFVYMMGVNIPYMYSELRTGIDRSYASMIVPIIGLTNVVVRICVGLIAYKVKLKAAFLCGLGMTFSGLVTLLSGFVGQDVVWFQLMVAFCFGLAPAFFASLRTTIYVETLGLEKLTKSFGITSMFMGIGIFIGTSMAGRLNQLTGGYQASFIMCGLGITLAGVTYLILPHYLERQEKSAANDSARRRVHFDESASRRDRLCWCCC